MRATRTEQQGADQEVAPQLDAEAGTEQQAQFTAQGTIPPVGAAQPEAAAPEASASDLAFGGGGGGGRATSGAGANGSGGGKPLPDDLKQKFEASLGADLSNVRIHTDGAAEQQTKAHGARATATGQDIHMAPGEYDPASPAGQELLAHEVAHTVQQKDSPRTQAKAATPAPTSAAERDADGAAAKMVTGEPASVTPVAEQAPHAAPDDYGKLVSTYKASLGRGDWNDAAVRLNGFSDDDIKSFVKNPTMTAGQRSHVRAAAEVAMPGWSQRVTGAIDAADAGASKDIAALYVAYEKAVVAARTSNNWNEVADRLNGMGDWDIADRLKHLSWPDFEGLRASSATARVITAVDVADANRARAVFAAYDKALATGDLQGACNQLNGMSDDDIKLRLRKGEFTQLSALKPFASPRVAVMIDAEIKSRPKAEQSANGSEPTKVDGVVDVVPPIVELPDFSKDARTTQEAHDSGKDWGGSPELTDFVDRLAQGYAERAADQQAAKSKTPIDRDQVIKDKKKETVTNFQNQWRRVLNEFAILSHMPNYKQYERFSTVARYWASDISQGRLFALSSAPGVKLDIAPGSLIADETERATKLEPMVKGGSYPVRPIVNDFMRNYTFSPAPSSWYNYSTHGAGALYQQGFSVDLMFDGATTAGRNAEGFVPREAALQVIHNIAHTAAAVGGDWQVCYNDFSVAEAARAVYGGRISYVGVNGGVDDPKKAGNANGHGTHAPLNLHFHLDIVPKTGAAPLGATGGGTSDGGKTDEKVPSPVGTTPQTETH